MEKVWSGRACGKAILSGEHFVVYGAPAIAIPLTTLVTEVSVTRVESPGVVLDLDVPLDDQSPVERLVTAALALLNLEPGGWKVAVRSCFPIGCGLGSSAALGVALLRALHQVKGEVPDEGLLNHQAFSLEELSHGTPSGVDNTVVTYQQPVFFERGTAPQPLRDLGACSWVVADSGERSITVEVVAQVGRVREERPEWFEGCLVEAKANTLDLLDCFRREQWQAAGKSLDVQHGLLAEIGVSSPRLEHLVGVARSSGALGAKLTGAGQGGCMLALCAPGTEEEVANALVAEGASQTWVVSTRKGNE